MDSDLAIVHQKLDQLRQQLEERPALPDNQSVPPNGREMEAMHQKLDAIMEQFEIMQQRQEELDELKRDLIPIANHMIKLSIDELAEIGSEFSLEDLLFLMKRLLRDTHLLVGLLDRMEGALELADETRVIGRQAFNQAVMTLDRLEREGYFSIAREGWKIIERIVREFNDDDVQALGDNIVTILSTVRNLTQPEIMALTNNALNAVREVPALDSTPSAWALARELSDPQVRRGMARLLNLVKVLADQPQIPNN